MRNTYLFLSVLFAIMLLQSCSSYRMCTFTGEPGTELHPKEKSTIDDTGRFTKECDQSDYNWLGFAKAPDSDIWVPYALDFEHTGRRRFITLLGAGVSIPGIVTLPLFMILANRAEDDDIRYSYRLCANQRTNCDLIYDPTVKTGQGKEPWRKVKVGDNVYYENFGTGKVIARTSTSITIKFSNDSVKFAFPEVFTSGKMTLK